MDNNTHIYIKCLNKFKDLTSSLKTIEDSSINVGVYIFENILK